MNYIKERNQLVCCSNENCQFWDNNENIKNCEASVRSLPAIASCSAYLPIVDHFCLHCSVLIKTFDGFHKGVVIDKIQPGYGSKHDTEVFCMALCDKCISKLKKQSKIVKIL